MDPRLAVAAALVLLLAVVALRRREPFCGPAPFPVPDYAPACDAQACPGRRRSGSGPTSGAMPAIEPGLGPLAAGCCGLLGVPV